MKVSDWVLKDIEKTDRMGGKGKKNKSLSKKNMSAKFKQAAVLDLASLRGLKLFRLNIIKSISTFTVTASLDFGTFQNNLKQIYIST